MNPDFTLSAPPGSIAAIAELIFLDGETAPLLFPLPVILDNLTASGKIPPLMALILTVHRL